MVTEVATTATTMATEEAIITVTVGNLLCARVSSWRLGRTFIFSGTIVYMEKMANTLEAFEAEAKDFLQTITPTAAGATLITFSGELGAGKTAFTKVIARELGVQEVVTSPTFVLEKIYRLSTGQRFARLIHIDAYRLDTGSELAALGFDEAMKDPENLILLEWPERVADALPPPAKRITIEVMASGARKVMYG